MLTNRLLATTAAIALAWAQVSPSFALSGSQIMQQNATPIPNPDGYTAQQLLGLPAPAMGAGATVGGNLIQPLLGYTPLNKAGDTMTGAPAWATFANQYQLFTANIGGLPPTSMPGNSQYAQAFAVNGFIDIPSTAQNTPSLAGEGGVSGAARSANPNVVPIGVAGWGMPNADGVPAFGANFGCVNTAKYNPDFATNTGYSGNCTGTEIDLYAIRMAGGAAPSGIFTGLLINAQFEAAPTGSATAIHINPLATNGSLGWSSAITIDPAPNAFPMQIWSQGNPNTSGAQPSQPVRFISKNANNVNQFSDLFNDATGNLAVNPGNGFQVNAQPGGVTVFNLFNSTAPADARMWQTLVDASGNYILRAANDAGTATTNLFAINRATTAITFGGALSTAAAGPSSTLGSLTLSYQYASIEMGSLAAAGSPIIDLHSSGSANDYDARIIASGGTSGTAGAGTLGLSAAVVDVSNGLKAAALPTSGGTVKGTLCADTTGAIYVKTTTGACL